jgi:hypothetical protein
VWIFTSGASIDTAIQKFFITAPALDTAEFGIIELNGWMFESGEGIEAICDGAVIWREEVP